MKQAIACGVAAFERGAELLGLAKAFFPCLPSRFGLLGREDAQGKRTNRIEDRPRKRGLLVIKDTADLSGGVLGDRAQGFAVDPRMALEEGLAEVALESDLEHGCGPLC